MIRVRIVFIMIADKVSEASMSLFSQNVVEAKSNLFLLDLYEYRINSIEAEKLKLKNVISASELYFKSIFFYQSAIEKAIAKVSEKNNQIEKDDYLRWLISIASSNVMDGIFFLIASRLNELGSVEKAKKALWVNEQLKLQIDSLLEQEEQKKLIEINLAMKVIEVDHWSEAFIRKSTNSAVAMSYAQRFTELLRSIISSKRYIWSSKEENKRWVEKHCNILINNFDCISDGNLEKKSLFEAIKQLPVSLKDQMKRYFDDQDKVSDQIDNSIRLVFEWKKMNVLRKGISQIKHLIKKSKEESEKKQAEQGLFSKLVWGFLGFCSAIASPVISPVLALVDLGCGTSCCSNYLNYNFQNIKYLVHFISENKFLSFSIAGIGALSIVFPFTAPLLGVPLGLVALPAATDLALNVLGVQTAVEDDKRLIRIEAENKVVKYQEKIEETKKESEKTLKEEKVANNAVMSREKIWGILARNYYKAITLPQGEESKRESRPTFQPQLKELKTQLIDLSELKYESTRYKSISSKIKSAINLSKDDAYQAIKHVVTAIKYRVFNISQSHSVNKPPQQSKISPSNGEEKSDKNLDINHLLGLRYQKERKDGNCLFHTIGRTLGIEQQELREITAKYIEKNPEKFDGFLEDLSLKDFCRQIRTQGVWGGEHAIRALMYALDRPILGTVNQNRISYIDENFVKRFKGKPIFYDFVNNNHYNSWLLEEGYDPVQIIEGMLQKQRNDNEKDKANRPKVESKPLDSNSSKKDYVEAKNQELKDDYRQIEIGKGEHNLDELCQFIDENILSLAVEYNCLDIIQDHVGITNSDFYQKNSGARHALFKFASMNEAESYTLNIINNILAVKDYSSLRGPTDESWLYVILKLIYYPPLKSKMITAIHKILESDTYFVINPEYREKFFELASRPIVCSDLLDAILSKILNKNDLKILMGSQGEDWLYWILNSLTIPSVEHKIEAVIKKIIHSATEFQIFNPRILTILLSLCSNPATQNIMFRILIEQLSLTKDLSLLNHKDGVEWLKYLMSAADLPKYKNVSRDILLNLFNQTTNYYMSHPHVLRLIAEINLHGLISEPLLEMTLDKIISSNEFSNLRFENNLSWQYYLIRFPNTIKLKEKLDLALTRLLPFNSEKSDFSAQILELMESKENEGVSSQQFEYILNCIINSEDLARYKSKNGDTWLDYIAKGPHYSALKDKVHVAIKKIIKLGIELQEQNRKNDQRIFHMLRKKDYYGITHLLHPEANNFNLFNCEYQAKAFTKILKNIKQDPDQEMHLVIFVGPPGTGKRSLALSAAHYNGYKISQIETQVTDGLVRQFEHNIHTSFSQIKNRGAGCIFMPNMDSLVWKTQGSTLAHEGHHNHATDCLTIQNEISNLVGHKAVLVGTTHNLAKINDAIKSQAHIIHFKLPDLKVRIRYLEYRLSMLEFEDNTLLYRVAEATSGWGFKKMAGFTEELKSEFADTPVSNIKTIELFEKARESLIEEYAFYGLEIISPSLKANTNLDSSEVLVSLHPNVQGVFRDINSLLAKPELYINSKRKLQQYYAFHGDPGVGKTALVREVADKNNAMLINLNPGQLGASSLRYAFNQAMNFDKALIFIDEFDTIFDTPEAKVLQTLVDGFKKKKNILVVVGATNNIELMPRPLVNRFTKVHFKLPNEEQRYDLFRHLLEKLDKSDLIYDPNSLDHRNIQIFSQASDGLPQRSIVKLFEDSAFALTDQEDFSGNDIEKLSPQYILNAISKELSNNNLATKIIDILSSKLVNLTKVPPIAGSVHSFHTDQSPKGINSLPRDSMPHDEDELKYDFR